MPHPDPLALWHADRHQDAVAACRAAADPDAAFARLMTCFSTDGSGHVHKGKGPGGGQFAPKGEGGDDGGAPSDEHKTYDHPADAGKVGGSGGYVKPGRNPHFDALNAHVGPNGMGDIAREAAHSGGSLTLNPFNLGRHAADPKKAIPAGLTGVTVHAGKDRFGRHVVSHVEPPAGAGKSSPAKPTDPAPPTTPAPAPKPPGLAAGVRGAITGDTQSPPGRGTPTPLARGDTGRTLAPIPRVAKPIAPSGGQVGDGLAGVKTKPPTPAVGRTTTVPGGDGWTKNPAAEPEGGTAEPPQPDPVKPTPAPAGAAGKRNRLTDKERAGWAELARTHEMPRMRTLAGHLAAGKPLAEAHALTDAAHPDPAKPVATTAPPAKPPGGPKPAPAPEAPTPAAKPPVALTPAHHAWAEKASRHEGHVGRVAEHLNVGAHQAHELLHKATRQAMEHAAKHGSATVTIRGKDGKAIKVTVRRKAKGFADGWDEGFTFTVGE